MPLLYFGLAICLTFKLFADGVKFTNIHGWDLEGSGRLFETVLERCQLGTLIPHLLLMNQCFFNNMWRTLAINVIVIVYVIVLQVFMYKNRMANLRSIMRILDKIEFQQTTARDEAYWVYRYSHPYIRVLGPKLATEFMNAFDAQMPIELLSETATRQQRRFNVPVADGSPIRIPRLDDDPASSVNRPFSDHMSSGRKHQESEKKLFQSNNRSVLNDDLGGIQLDFPLNIRDEMTPISEKHFSSNSHFRKDGLYLDLAATPLWHRQEKSNGESLSLGQLKQVRESDQLDNQQGLDRAASPVDRQLKEMEQEKSPHPSREDTKQLSMIDLRRNKVISPIPLTLTKKNKTEGRISLQNWKKLLLNDKQVTQNFDDNSKDALSVPKQVKEDQDNQTSKAQGTFVEKEPLGSFGKLPTQQQ